MDYDQTLDYIYSFVDYGLKSRYKYSPDTFDLTRMRTLLARLGDPQRRLPSLHVAGTKGKGSVSAMAASILRAARYRVGLYTSPHLNDFCERIQFDDQPISHDTLSSLTTELRPVFDSLPGVTTFEITTALAHEWFARQRATFGVFEVGLGGRLDATNVLHPNACAITSLSYDHIQLLGNTLPEIAEEKAGIIKPGVPVVCAPQSSDALEKISSIARDRGARLRVIGRDWIASRDSVSDAGQRFSIQPSTALQPEVGEWAPTPFDIPLLGQHQIENAAVAVAMIHELRMQGFEVPLEAIQRGLATVSWPGRFEVIRDSASSKTIVLDCAHNRDSASKLAATVKETFPDAHPALIFGASDDKDVEGMLAELLPLSSRMIVAKADHPRASNAERLAETSRQIGVARSVNVAHTVADALADARGGPEQIILVTGSVFLVADVRLLLKS
ncbi:MAG: bifunctional folylpolyglutamate synthase/dihydrofolate synthase [Chloroflexi bacterium]|nr:bifunctional folylpolyglutamate synthase/dihydrofolate synthase [Chloroflexota bacterium]